MNNEEKILAMLEQLQQGQSQINNRLDSIEQGQTAMQGDMTEAKGRLDSIEQRVAEMGVVQENITNFNITLIHEGLERIEGKLEKQDKMETALEEHDRRIWVLEQAVRTK